MGNVGRLLSVNVGLPRDIVWQGRTVHTGIWKDPVKGPRMVRRLNIDGDGQGDLAGHGGERRAVFVYQIDSYRYWQDYLKRNDFIYGQFGENFTVDGLPDAQVCIGDRYRIGGALFEVTQPRVTCYRLGIRLNEPEMAALVVKHGRPGFYFRVIEEGNVEAGDEITQVGSGPEQMSVSEIDALLYKPGHPRDQLERALRIPTLSAGWHHSLEALLNQERDGNGAAGNAGLNKAPSPAPAWTGFRPLRVARKVRESGTVTSLLLEPTDGQTVAAALPGQFIVLRLGEASTPALMRSYSLSGEPGDFPLSRQHQAGSPRRGQQLHPRQSRGRRHRASQRGARQFYIEAGRNARCVAERRDRRDAGARDAACAGGGGLDEGYLVALRRPQRSRTSVCRRGA